MGQIIAALTAKLSANAGQSPSVRIQLLPFGRFRSSADNRPTDAEHWILDDTNGFAIAQQANARINDLVIDYEHQTLYKEQNGQPAPAAGWIESVVYISGKGLFADVVWTNKAASMIQAKEYRYISAVFIYDSNGYVLKLLHAAITNCPALDGMDELIAACSQFFTTKEDNEMEEYKKLLRALFKMPDASDAQLQAALSALVKEQPKEVALSAVFKELKARNEQIAALSAQSKKPDPAKVATAENQLTLQQQIAALAAQSKKPDPAKVATAENQPTLQEQIAALAAQVNNPDPAKVVPVETMQALHQQVAALSAQIHKNESLQVINEAIKDGKLLPAQKEWAEQLAATPDGISQLKNYLATIPQIASLSAQFQPQSTGCANQNSVAALSADDREAAKMLGYTEKDYINLFNTNKEAN